MKMKSVNIRQRKRLERNEVRLAWIIALDKIVFDEFTVFVEEKDASLWIRLLKPKSFKIDKIAPTDNDAE